MKKKKINKVLEEVVKGLPLKKYEYISNYSIMGKDVGRSGIKVPEGMEIDDEKEYQFKQVALNQANHKRRVRRAFESGGKAAVYNYIMPYIKPDKRIEALRYVHSLPL
jgi:hypothetical protein